MRKEKRDLFEEFVFKPTAPVVLKRWYEEPWIVVPLVLGLFFLLLVCLFYSYRYAQALRPCTEAQYQECIRSCREFEPPLAVQRANIVSGDARYHTHCWCGVGDGMRYSATPFDYGKCVRQKIWRLNR